MLAKMCSKWNFQPVWKAVWQFLKQKSTKQQKNIYLIFDSGILLLEMKAHVHIKTYTWMFIDTLFTTNRK